MTRKPLLVFLALTACHASPRAPQPAPLSSPQVRVDAAIERWATALRSGDRNWLMKTEDQAGQFALVYGAIKYASSYVPDGTQAVETTLTGIIGITFLQLVAPGIFGPPFETFYVALPTGRLGPPLVAAGLAAPMVGTPLTVVALPWNQTIGRVTEGQERHTAKLRARRAWTCRAVAIEKTVLPSEPSLVAMAQVSQNIFADWLRGVEALWLVRAECEGAPALFVVTADLDGNDRILLATGPRTPDELRGQVARALAMTGE